jgi:mRNA-degrading endonuclease RelE of RelBE toxin-antitoxin system
MSDDWDWKLADSAKREFDSLDGYARERLVSKLDEVVEDPWRTPADYLEPLSGVPHRKLRVGPFRLGCRADGEAQILWVLTVKKRGGDAYRSDDD